MSEIQQSREKILHVAEAHGARNVRLFGSVARGKATKASDVDLLVHFDADRSLIDHVALKQDLEHLLGHRVDVVEEESLHRSIREQILSEAIAL